MAIYSVPITVGALIIYRAHYNQKCNYICVGIYVSETCHTMLIHAASLPVAFSQMISSSLPDGRVLCPGEEIIFICVTRGSTVISWTSDEYIARNKPLEFTTIDDVGETHTSTINPDVVALLVRETNDGGTPVLESLLRVIASPLYPNSSVTCVHVDDGTRHTISFQVLGTEFT